MRLRCFSRHWVSQSGFLREYSDRMDGVVAGVESVDEDGVVDAEVEGIEVVD